MAYTTLQQAVDDITVKNQTLTNDVLAADTKSTTDKDAAVAAKTAAEAAEQGAIDARDLASQHKDAAALSDTNALAAQTQAEAQVPLAVAEGDRAVAARDAAVLTALGPDNDRLASIASVYGQPSLNLDFAKQEFWKQGTYPWNQQTLDPNLDLTVQRATTKWVFDATGTLVEVPIDTLAFDHDPVTGEPLGVLIEESRTNLLTWSEDMTGWNQASNSAVTFFPAGGYGGRGYSKLEATTEGSSRNRVFTLSEGVQTITIAFKAGSVSSGAVGVYTGSGFFAATCKKLSGPGTVTGTSLLLVSGLTESEWTVVQLSLTTPLDGPYSLIVYVNDTGSVSYVGDSIFLSRCQAEQGTFPTSYIPTAGAAVTRAADKIRWTLGNEGNPDGYTVFAEFLTEAINTNFVFTLTENSINNRVSNYIDASGRSNIFIQANGVARKADNIPYVSFTSANKTAVVVSPLNAFGALNGAVDSIPDGALPGVTKLEIGYGNSFAPKKLRIKKVSMYPRAMTAAELQEVTTP